MISRLPHHPDIAVIRLRRIALSATPLILSLFLKAAWAVDTIPGQAVAPAPDLNLFMASYGNVRLGDRYVDGRRQRPGTALENQVILLRYTRTFELGGQPAAFYIQPSFVRSEPGGALAAADAASGTGDLAASFAYWMHADREKGEYFATASYLQLPTGEYDSSKLINIGSNRAAFAQQIGYQARLGGPWSAMLTGDVQWYGANDDYRLTHQRQTQKPLFSMQATLMADLDPTTLMALSYYRHRGGETSLDGRARDDRIRRSRLGLAFSKQTGIGKLILQYGKDLDTENGFITEHEAYLRWQITWR